jgi:hypothetical protein
MHKNQLYSTKEKSLDDMLLRDGEGDVALERINERSLLLPICNIYCGTTSCRWWWTVLTQTISDMTT